MIKNLTPHPVNICDGSGAVIATIMPETTPARLAAKVEAAEMIDGIATSQTVFGEPENLPAQADSVWFIVSQIIKSAQVGRTDLLVPAEVVRDKSGNIIGCRSLGR